LPNWCSNNLTISGDVIEVLALIERASSGEHVLVGPFNNQKMDTDWGDFTPIQMELFMRDDDLFRDHRVEKSVLSFHAFVPMPREVMLAPYDCNRLREAAAKYPEWFGRFPDLLSGYNWEHSNWGVKWGASDAYISDQGRTGDCYSVFYDFNTAWGPPITFMDKLAALYPNLMFSLSYSEEGMNFAGDVEWRGGVCTEHNERECDEGDSEEEEEYNEEEE
jgi:hypothetical protein